MRSVIASSFHKARCLCFRPLLYRNTQKLFLTSASANQNSKVSDAPDNVSQKPFESPESSESVDSEKQKIIDENNQLLEKLEELDDKYKRSLAENENIRMRMRREVSDAKQFGVQNFVRDLLDVADVLNKATESVPKEALDEKNNYLKQLYEGLQVTQSQLHMVFRRYGVSQVNPIGEKFDPNVHEALCEQEDPTKEPGTVALVAKVGYKLHDRVIRPAMVGVVKASS